MQLPGAIFAGKFAATQWYLYHKCIKITYVGILMIQCISARRLAKEIPSRVLNEKPKYDQSTTVSLRQRSKGEYEYTYIPARRLSGRRDATRRGTSRRRRRRCREHASATREIKAPTDNYLAFGCYPTHSRYQGVLADKQTNKGLRG